MKQGGYAEGKVRTWLNKHKGDRAGFTFNRILDAHSARGAMSNPQPGDFQWFLATGWQITNFDQPGMPGNWERNDPYPCYTRNGIIEVKETQNASKLPYKNFTPDQVGRMRIREMAGSEALVLVCFRHPSGKPFWRSAPLSFFMGERKLVGKTGGSWDMSEFDAYTDCGDILKEYLK
jgi:hypothetical protein